MSPEDIARNFRAALVARGVLGEGESIEQLRRRIAGALERARPLVRDAMRLGRENSKLTAEDLLTRID